MFDLESTFAITNDWFLEVEWRAKALTITSRSHAAGTHYKVKMQTRPTRTYGLTQAKTRAAAAGQGHRSEAKQQQSKSNFIIKSNFNNCNKPWSPSTDSTEAT